MVRAFDCGAEMAIMWDRNGNTLVGGGGRKCNEIKIFDPGLTMFVCSTFSNDAVCLIIICHFR